MILVLICTTYSYCNNISEYIIQIITKIHMIANEYQVSIATQICLVAVF